MCMIRKLKPNQTVDFAVSLSPALLIQSKATEFAQSLATGTQNTEPGELIQALMLNDAFTAQLGAALTLHRHCLARVEHVAGVSNLS